MQLLEEAHSLAGSGNYIGQKEGCIHSTFGE